MTRYVERKKLGISIGSDNNFFFRDEEGKFHDFPCIVGISSLYFDNHSTLHVDIRSPVEQLLFYPVILSETKTYDGVTWEEKRKYYRLKSFWLKWLNDNCPGWGYPPPKFADRIPTLFFAERSHAVMLVSRIEEALAGMRFI